MKVFIIFSILFLTSAYSFAGQIDLVSGHPDRVHHAVSAINNLGHEVVDVHEDRSLQNKIVVRGPSGSETFTLSLNCINKMRKGVRCESGQPIGTMCALQNDAVNSAAFVPVSEPAVVEPVNSVSPQPLQVEWAHNDDLGALLALGDKSLNNLQETPYTRRVTDWGGRAISGTLRAAGTIVGAEVYGNHLVDAAKARRPDVFTQTIRNGNFNNSSNSTSKSWSSSSARGGSNHITQNNTNNAGDTNVDVNVEGGGDPPSQPEEPREDNNPGTPENPGGDRADNDPETPINPDGGSSGRSDNDGGTSI